MYFKVFSFLVASFHRKFVQTGSTVSLPSLKKNAQERTSYIFATVLGRETNFVTLQRLFKITKKVGLFFSRVHETIHSIAGTAKEWKRKLLQAIVYDRGFIWNKLTGARKRLFIFMQLQVYQNGFTLLFARIAKLILFAFRYQNTARRHR